MTTDKTPATLATVKHGGCVQLGDGLLPCPFCGNGAEFVPYKNNGLTLKCKSMGCIQRHQRTLRYGIEWLRTSMTEHWNTRTLAAPPSPADALPDIESWSKGYDSGYARAVADFAASQPAGEPVCSGGFVISNGSGEKYMAWGQVGPEWVADRSAALWLVRRADAEALAAENEDAWSILSVERCALPPRGWACTLADGHEGPCPTIAAPPAQAVDLWQPIETAPKNGSSMLLGYVNSAGNWRTVRGRWFSAEKIEMEWENADDFEAGWYEESVEADDIPNVWPTTPTHWQPLPAAPSVDSQAVGNG
ncbi:hypothetical protein [Stenotrophomonas maltophilia]|uniref:hypothetical protein n=1 Tax=Stenotrophomonas maltophilia TaxID=40324 RepID=UPI000C25A877|nr:hypothetical protein [Stenotrophomonas maltophilia]PJL44701.1 hypothetical protein B9Y56_08430 [Stenotrophomonas maltophilia]